MTDDGDTPAMKRLAQDLETYLRNPYTPGRPHIGVLGPRPDTGPTEGEDADLDAEDSSPDADVTDPSLDPEWRFVPNKAIADLTWDPFSEEPLKTSIQFAVRLAEGCELDLDDTPQAEQRHELGKLPRDDVLRAIAYYDVYIETSGPGHEPTINVYRKVGDRDPEPVDVDFDINDDGEIQEVNFHLRATSEPFLTYYEKKPWVRTQDYDVVIDQRVERRPDGKLEVTLAVVNESPWSPMSRLPELRLGNGGGHLSRGQSLARIFKEGGPPAHYEPGLWKVEGASSNASGNNYGYLMDFLVKFHLANASDPYGDKEAARTVNVINAQGPPERGGTWEGDLVFKDSAVFREEIPTMAAGSPPDEVLGRLGIADTVSSVFADDKGWPHLYKFQEAAIEAVVSALRGDEYEGVLMSARTASGKTEAFAIPVVDYCLTHVDRQGTKAMIFYPTKALGNDQANRFIEVLYHVNRLLAAEDKRSLTLGILHGDVTKDVPERPEDVTDLPLACPATLTDGAACPGRLRPVGDRSVECEHCEERLDFVYVYSRRSSYSDPPDVLITNPDTMTWDLMARPWNHSILGRPTWVCEKCLKTHIAVGHKRKCDQSGCPGSVKLIEPSVPEILVFDEVHLFKGAFGINTGLFLSRLKAVLRRYARQYHEDEDHTPTLIGSTATISNPATFAEEFFHLPEDRIAVIPKDEDERASFYDPPEGERPQARYHLAILPYSYQADSTVARAVQYLETRWLAGKPPVLLTRDGATPGRYDGRADPLQVLTFVNNIRTSNNLIAATRRGFSAEDVEVKVGGHTTDFDKEQRAETERAFNRGDTNVLFATSTLEVGVDFRHIHVVVPYGMPYSFNDYLQRIGRCGRVDDGLVVTVCQNWKPVDHYYFTGLRQQLRDPLRAVEPVPLVRENIEATKLHAKCAVMDYMASHDRSPTWLDDVRKLPVDNDLIKMTDFKQYVDETLDPPDGARDEVMKDVERFVGELNDERAGRLQPVEVYRWFWSELNKKHQLTNMRSTDPQVLVEVMM